MPAPETSDLTPIFELQAAEVIQRAADSFKHRHSRAAYAFAAAAIQSGVRTLFAVQGERRTRAFVKKLVLSASAKAKEL
jgi:hypothetical protein